MQTISAAWLYPLIKTGAGPSAGLTITANVWRVPGGALMSAGIVLIARF